ncbi:MAG: HAD-IA family hydrolase [Oscillospiraceae bacterium]|jgi:phosphoglycolate phosphatase-like HAD superfamily hydrolase|nr:HAD-IA family hydrolase [Oscillospiraceae bacterium]
MDFKHVIWDFDGTLFDTYPHTAQAFLNLLRKEHMIHENILEIQEQMRVSMQHAYDYYKDKYEIDDEFIAKFENYRVIYENRYVLPHINAHMVCRFIYDQGSVNYLCTHRDNSVISMMQKHGFDEIFKDYVTAENKFPKKPNPAGLLYLIEKHSMNKDETLYIGDRSIDLECAGAAGVKFCLFKENVNKTLEIGEADFSVQNFSDFYYILNATLTTRNNEQ